MYFSWLNTINIWFELSNINSIVIVPNLGKIDLYLGAVKNYRRLGTSITTQGAHEFRGFPLLLKIRRKSIWTFLGNVKFFFQRGQQRLEPKFKNMFLNPLTEENASISIKILKRSINKLNLKLKQVLWTLGG
jgi:hypothetical protein